MSTLRIFYNFGCPNFGKYMSHGGSTKTIIKTANNNKAQIHTNTSNCNKR